MVESQTIKNMFLIIISVLLTILVVITIYRMIKKRNAKKQVVVPPTPASLALYSVPSANNVPTISVPIVMAPPAINNLNKPRQNYSSLGVGGGFYYDQNTGRFQKW